MSGTDYRAYVEVVATAGDPIRKGDRLIDARGDVLYRAKPDEHATGVALEDASVGGRFRAGVHFGIASHYQIATAGR